MPAAHQALNLELNYAVVGMGKVPSNEAEEALILGLEKLVVDDPEFRELSAIIRPYCPFEALGIVGAEIRHGNFLAYMLDPFRPHGYGSTLLREFLAVAISNPNQLPIKIPITRLDVHLLDLGDAEVRREWHNIDLLLIIHEIQMVVAIELKIDSTQHSQQLRRYRNTVQGHWPLSENWKHLFLFLTKNDENPEDDKYWLPVKLRDLIVPLEKCGSSANADPLAAHMLAAYAAMMKRRHLSDDKIDEIVRKLWATHGEVLAYLSDRRPDQMGECFERIRDTLPKLEERLGPEWVLDSETANILRFAYTPWDTLDGFSSAVGWSQTGRLILFELKREGNRLNGLVCLGPGDGEPRHALLNRIWQERGDAPPSGRWAIIQRQQFVSIGQEATFDPVTNANRAMSDFINFAQAIAQDLQQVVGATLQPRGIL